MNNILVIDDNQDITAMLETVLSSDTCHVQTAENGLAGLQLLREHPFDVVITDIIMPEKDGYEVITEVNGMQPRPQVIAMTGGPMCLCQESRPEVANALNVQRVLFKPFSIDELLESLCLPDLGTGAMA